MHAGDAELPAAGGEGTDLQRLRLPRHRRGWHRPGDEEGDELLQRPGAIRRAGGDLPDGQFTLVECDKQNLKGSGNVDLWKLKLDGSGHYERLTYFSDYPGYKASNPVVSDDGRFIAFQMAKSREAAGVGHGIFVYDLDKAGKTAP